MNETVTMEKPVGHKPAGFSIYKQPSDDFTRKVQVTSTMAMDLATVERNINWTLDQGYPNFWKLPEVFKFKMDTRIAIVGGGPSVNEFLDEINNQNEIIMVCGSAHDHLVSKGVIPHYCVIVDPDAISANYVRNPVDSCQYLVASQCDRAVFDALNGFNVIVWNCAGGVDHSIYRGQPAVGGGCTVMLRAMSLALIMGYGNMHIYGMDSCLIDDRHHAYDAEDVNKPAEIKVAGSDKVFMAAPFMIAQAQQFQDMIRNHGKYFTPTVYGDGLIAEIMRVGALKAKEQEIHHGNSR